MTIEISEKTWIIVPVRPCAKSASSRLRFFSCQGVARRPVASPRKRATARASCGSFSLTSILVTPSGSTNKGRAVCNDRNATRSSRLCRPVRNTPLTVNCRSTPRSVRSRIDCPAPSPRSSAMRAPISRPSAPRSPSPLIIFGVICEIASMPCGSIPMIVTGETASLRTRKALPVICGLIADTDGLARSSSTIVGQSRICLR